MSEIENRLIRARHLYDVGQSTEFTDAEYDRMVEELQQSNPASPFFDTFGSMPEYGVKETLPSPMGSLNQLKDQASIAKWVEAREGADFCLSEKLDGVSLQLVYRRGVLVSAHTRGDGYVGINVTKMAICMRNLPGQLTADIDIKVRGEVIISKQAFATYIKGYKNARNFVAGQVNSKDQSQDFLAHAEFVAFYIDDSVGLSKAQDFIHLKQLGFKTAKHAVYTEINQEMLSEQFDRFREESEYELDGIVVDYNDAATRYNTRPAKDQLNPDYSFKYKENGESNTVTAEVVNVHWAPSKDGYLKPRVEIVPVNIGGVTVTYATGFNAKFIHENQIGDGAIIKLTRSGDVIPHILEVVTPAEPIMPGGSWHWSPSKVDAILDNAHEHDEVRAKRFHHFFGCMSLDGLGGVTVQSWFDSGYTIEQIIKADVNFFRRTVGETVGPKVRRQLQEKLNNISYIEVAHALQACGRNQGMRKLRSVWDKFKTIEVSPTEVASVKGIGEAAARQICAGFEKAYDFVMENDIKVVDPEEEVKVEGSLSDTSFVFTGVRDRDLEDVILGQGGEIWNSVKPGLTYLVAKNPNGTSNKLKKARELGVKIIDLKQAQDIGGRSNGGCADGIDLV